MILGIAVAYVLVSIMHFLVAASLAQRTIMVLSRAIKKTLKQRAVEIKANLIPVGYSVPSAEVKIFVNSTVSGSLASTTSFVGGPKLCLVDSASMCFSFVLAFALLSVSDVESSMTDFCVVDMFAVVKER